MNRTSGSVMFAILMICLSLTFLGFVVGQLTTCNIRGEKMARGFAQLPYCPDQK